MTNVWYVIKNIMANCDGNMYLPILHLLWVVALQVARKIASCDRPLKVDYFKTYLLV